MQPLDSPPARADHIVPFTMKRLGGNADPLHFFVRHSSPRRILAPVEATGHGQPLRGGRARDQAHDRLVVPQRLTTPIRGDEREQAVLHLVPLAGARWEVADLDGQGGGIGELLQLELPHAQAIAIAAPAIRRDQQSPSPRVQPVALEPPPAPDRGHRKGARVVAGAHVHEAFVAGQIIHAVGIGPGGRGSRKIVALHEGGRFAPAPLPALVLVVPDQLLLLRVHGDDRSAPGHRPADLIIDVLELRVAVGMIRAFLGLPVPLEAVVHRAQELRHLLMADRMVLAREFRRERPRALARPAQGGLRVAARQGHHQGLQRSRQFGVAHQEREASPAGPPDPSGRDRVLPQFADPLGDGDPGQSTDTADPRDASIALVHGLVRGHHSPAALIQVSPDACELPFESVMSFDAPTVACSGLICRCYLLTRANAQIDTDVRILAATTRDLELAMARREFREDLYYRLNSAEIRIPPLREREAEIPILAEQFLAMFNRQYGRSKRISAETMSALVKHSWGGNVRELENAIRRMVALTDGEQA